MEREPYAGEAVPVMSKSEQNTNQGEGDTKPVDDVIVPTQASDQFYRRPPTRSGGRNLQESSFSFSGQFYV